MDSINSSIRTGMVRTDTMLLTGVIISFVCSSLVMLLIAVSSSEELQRIVFWIMGSPDETNLALIRICLTGSLIDLAVSLLFCRDLNALTLGEEEASGLGVTIERSKKILFITASILTGLRVSAAGRTGRPLWQGCANRLARWPAYPAFSPLYT